MDAQTLKAQLTRNRSDSLASAVSAGLISALRSHLRAICGSERGYRQFLRYAFGTDTSANLFAEQWANLRDWLKPRPFADGNGGEVWTVAPECEPAARAIIAAQDEADRQAAISAGQLSLF